MSVYDATSWLLRFLYEEYGFENIEDETYVMQKVVNMLEDDESLEAQQIIAFIEEASDLNRTVETQDESVGAETSVDPDSVEALANNFLNETDTLLDISDLEAIKRAVFDFFEEEDFSHFEKIEIAHKVYELGNQ